MCFSCSGHGSVLVPAILCICQCSCSSVRTCLTVYSRPVSVCLSVYPSVQPHCYSICIDPDSGLVWPGKTSAGHRTGADLPNSDSTTLCPTEHSPSQSLLFLSFTQHWPEHTRRLSETHHLWAHTNTTLISCAKFVGASSLYCD